MATIWRVLVFPAEIKNALNNWRVGPEDVLHDCTVYILQGTAPGRLIGTLYFDKEQHLLTRAVRQTPSPGGTDFHPAGFRRLS